VESFPIELVEVRIIEIPQTVCKTISPALEHAPPLNVVEQMEIESITRFLPEILASLGTCCPWSRHRDSTVDHPAFEQKRRIELPSEHWQCPVIAIIRLLQF